MAEMSSRFRLENKKENNMDKITQNDDNNVYVMDDWEGPTTYVVFI